MTVSTYRESSNFLAKQPRTPSRISGVYDFDEHGGAVGSISLPIWMPPRSIITEGYVYALTNPNSGGAATIALDFGSDSVLTATAYGSLTGLNQTVQDGTDTNAIINNSDSSVQLTMTIAVAALTAGKLAISMSVHPLPQEAIG